MWLSLRHQVQLKEVRMAAMAKNQQPNVSVDQKLVFKNLSGLVDSERHLTVIYNFMFMHQVAPWPGDSKVTFLSSSQAVTFLPHTEEALHSPF